MKIQVLNLLITAEYDLNVLYRISFSFYCMLMSYIQTCLLAVTFLRPMPSIHVANVAPSRSLVILKVKTSYAISCITGHESML